MLPETTVKNGPHVQEGNTGSFEAVVGQRKRVLKHPAWVDLRVIGLSSPVICQADWHEKPGLKRIQRCIQLRSYEYGRHKLLRVLRRALTTPSLTSSVPYFDVVMYTLGT
jgi:hypothetical protein